jgi:transcriptional regulator with XRE-family HTH domain
MQPDHYYHCNGRQFSRGLYGLTGKKCAAKSINGKYVEEVVWADIESFLRDPGEILERLRDRLSMKGDEEQRRQKELEQFRDRLEEKTAERERMLGLFRRGRIDDATLDQHLDIINAETVGLQAEIDMAERALSVGDQTAQLKSAESLLAALRKRLDSPVSPELKRRIVETLVEGIRADTVERWGVSESKITVTYRFTEPNEAAALVMPRSYSLTSRTRAPDKLDTLGDHVRRRRLTLKLIQRQVAEQIGVDATSIHNWETNVSKPSLQYMPAILLFLRYNPVPPGSGWAERLVQCRTALGLSQKESAKQLGVDASTLARWERAEREPAGAFLGPVTRFLNKAEAVSSEGAVQVA